MIQRKLLLMAIVPLTVIYLGVGLADDICVEPIFQNGISDERAGTTEFNLLYGLWKEKEGKRHKSALEVEYTLMEKLSFELQMESYLLNTESENIYGFEKIEIAGKYLTYQNKNTKWGLGLELQIPTDHKSDEDNIEIEPFLSLLYRQKKLSVLTEISFAQEIDDSKLEKPEFGFGIGFFYQISELTLALEFNSADNVQMLVPETSFELYDFQVTLATPVYIKQDNNSTDYAIIVRLGYELED